MAYPIGQADKVSLFGKDINDSIVASWIAADQAVPLSLLLSNPKEVNQRGIKRQATEVIVKRAKKHTNAAPLKLHPLFVHTPTTDAHDSHKSVIRPSNMKSCVAAAYAEEMTEPSEPALLKPKKCKGAAVKATDAKASLLEKKNLPRDFVDSIVCDEGVSRSATYAQKVKVEVKLGIHK
ncbi:hypothetical protein ARMGADRAFT_1089085 [Armillaria gallica]|uniref:Uncharacterized protein n=1 Tax=Armillaria gallica TaxID=47427 RepID=A0A2H3CKU4_ARMGA|nr:hypothetical protein ARMGADRAFT_1089085 [Armillaria gallica]